VCLCIKADVLVNPVTRKTPHLADAGVVSSSLIRVAGAQLQTVSAVGSVENVLIVDFLPSVDTAVDFCRN